jgi:cytochrome c-type biogenesis protein CcmF
MILMALTAAAVGAPIAFVAGRGRRPELLRIAQIALAVFAGLLIAANGVMIYALVTHDFSVSYVAKVGSTKIPTWVSVVSLWSSLEGSILFWGAMLGTYYLAALRHLSKHHRDHLADTIGMLLLCGVFFSFLLAGPANPFEVMSPVPPEGPGPNPLLQNHLLMIIHPPMLYGGYVGMTVPFAIAAAALVRGHFGRHLANALRLWLMIPWAFLTVGIVLGGWWAYEVLGWGGFWDWDPVENASFFPWLTATAAVHSIMVVRRRGALKVWTITLVMVSFLLTILGTFMTRSGIFNSVHSFTQSDIGPTFLSFLAIVFVGSVFLLAARMNRIEAEGVIDDPRSREAAFLLNNLVFVLFTFTVVTGTVFPLIVEAIKGTKISVGSPYFNTMAVPLGVSILFLMGIGPALPWGRSSWARTKAALLPPAIGGVLLLALGVAMGARNGWALTTLFAAGYTVQVTAVELSKGFAQRGFSAGFAHLLGAGRQRFGGYVVHIGVILIIVAIAISQTARQHAEFSLKKGESATLAGYTLTYLGPHESVDPVGCDFRAPVQAPNGCRLRATSARIEARRGETALGELRPAMNHYKSQREPIGTPAVRTTWKEDLYLSLMSLRDGGERVGLRAYVNPMIVWLWIGLILMAIGSALSIIPGRRP